MHLYKYLAKVLIAMTFIYLYYEMKKMVPTYLTKLLESSNVVNVKLISKMKRVYNNLHYTFSIITFWS